MWIFTNISKFRTKKFFNIRPRAQRYKTIYIRNISYISMKRCNLQERVSKYYVKKVLWDRPLAHALIGLHHPLDGITNREYKLLCFIQLSIFCKEKKTLAFNRDRCCHLALCLRLILFHWSSLPQKHNKCKLRPQKMRKFRKKFYNILPLLGDILNNLNKGKGRNFESLLNRKKEKTRKTYYKSL